MHLKRTVAVGFVIGVSDRVLSQSHQLVFNPFHGYPEGDRNILDTRREERIKELSAIDGAFVPRKSYAETAVPDGADVKVVHLISGG